MTFDEPLHAVYAPSSLYRIIACPASVRESSVVPMGKPSSYAERGTLLHTVVVDVRENGIKAFFKYLDITEQEKGWIIDCIEYEDVLLKTCSKSSITSREERVDLGTWGLDTVWGTADLIIHDIDNGLVHVVDWKFGSGVQVYAEDNEQAMTYASGVVGFPSTVNDIHIHIVQPPLSHFDEWIIEYDRLRQFVFGELEPALRLAEKLDAPYNPGEKQCRFCPASMNCKARFTDALESAKMVYQNYSALPKISNEDLAEVLRAAKRYQAYIKDLTMYAQDKLMAGEDFPGFKLVEGRSTRDWKNAEDAEGWLINNTAIPDKDLYVKKFISPAQAEKLDRALKKEEDFKDLFEKKPGKPQLADEDDKRPALPPTRKATDAFADFA